MVKKIKLKSGAIRYVVENRDQTGYRSRVKYKTEAEAEAADDQAKVDIRKGIYVKPVSDTIADLAWQWFARKKQTAGYRFGTLQGWEIHIRDYIVPELGTLPVQRATVQHIEDASLVWAQRQSANTANCVLKTLTAVFYFAQRRNVLEPAGVNVAKQAERVKLTTEEQSDGEVRPEDVYSEEQLGALIEATEPGTLERILIWLGGFCGLRIGEILGFGWLAVDLKAARSKIQVIANLVPAEKAESDFPGYRNTGRTLKEPKKKSKRAIDAARELIHDLKLWRLKCPASRPVNWVGQKPERRAQFEPIARALVIVTVEGKPLQKKAAQALLDEATERANADRAAGEKIPRRTLHRLRHSYASNLLMAGEAPLKVSKLLGHKDLATTTRVYTHFIEDDSTPCQDLATRVLARARHSKASVNED